MTGPFGDKTDVVAKHWKTHVAEERSDIVSELACMGLAHLEEWHYSAFDSSGTCSLGLISTESIPNPTGKDTKIVGSLVRILLSGIFEIMDFDSPNTRQKYL